MKYFTAISAGLALAGLTSAMPLVAREKTAAAIIGEIAPTSLSCAETTECRTNVQAAPFFITAFSNRTLMYPGQMAAVLALTAFETQDYKYKHNISPGRPGQGTSNMQMVEYNIEYANSIPELQPKVAALGTIDTDAKKNQLLALVTADEYNFGSGAWYLTKHCPEVVPQLATGTDAAFNAYMQCVGVELTSARSAYWTRAKSAFGL
ncbi:hypothetical protein F5Y12DRAFT_383060 [Xylaria sp. FL1777]|nr:hypothetical protein F5Y12DRAFT_383060 [Xylaria sp. FL1777]